MSSPLLREDGKKRETIDARDSVLTRLHKILGMFLVFFIFGKS